MEITIKLTEEQLARMEELGVSVEELKVFIEAEVDQLIEDAWNQ